MNKLYPVALILALSGALWLAAPVMAQTQDTMPGEMAPATDVSDAELMQFANAMQAVNDIRDQYSQRIETAGDQNEAQQLQQEAGQRMTMAVQDAGMTVDDYNEIAVALQSDPELMQRLEQLIVGG